MNDSIIAGGERASSEESERGATPAARERESEIFHATGGYKSYPDDERRVSAERAALTRVRTREESKMVLVGGVRNSSSIIVVVAVL